MKPHPTPRPLLLTLGLLLAPAASAQTDFVALHPCAIVGEKDKAKVQDHQALCATEIARGDIQLVPSDLVRAFLDKEPKKSCAPAKKPAECLGRLATATQASRAVLITLDPGQLTRVSGLVVNPRGEVVDQKSIQIRSRGQPQAELIRTAITRLREQLNLVPLKVTPLVEQPPLPPLVATTPPPAQETTPLVPAPLAEAPTASAPPPAVGVSQSASSDGRTWKTPVAYASAGAGVVALGLSGFFAISGNNAMVESNKPYANNRYPPQSELANISQLRQQATTQRILAGVSAGVGAALVGTGVYLWLHDRKAPPAPGVAALSVGPGGVSVLGVLP
ncbi:hypothetical protein ATI61_107206 [Archangium gephyra]|uniref:Uncharacterized protein n=1 Tax=Archangium gephyra TaxID=48 RepID=A0AAC8TK91_9BACT|nr:hypothetical protein [Archangium gephyra]AKJ07756.1 Hypothetical protein AA314_09382 [Archangium gephyra]REG29510.1 hypothetical protein ATI61_107206 [Archangium gephyra]